MSKENVKKFLELVKTEEKLAKNVVELKSRLQAKANAESEQEILAREVLPLAKEYGCEFTVEEFLAYSNAVAGELSDDDLLNVSGGLNARGVALGLLFATGLSFVPAIISSFAVNEQNNRPSYSQSSKSKRKRNKNGDQNLSAAELETRKKLEDKKEKLKYEINKLKDKSDRDRFYERLGNVGADTSRNPRTLQRAYTKLARDIKLALLKQELLEKLETFWIYNDKKQALINEINNLKIKDFTEITNDEEFVNKKKEFINMFEKADIGKKRLSRQQILNEYYKYCKKGYEAFLTAGEFEKLNSRDITASGNVIQDVNVNLNERRKLADLSVEIITAINNLLPSNPQMDESTNLIMQAYRNEVRTGNDDEGNNLTEANLELIKLKVQQLTKIYNLLVNYGPSKKIANDLNDAISKVLDIKNFEENILKDLVSNMVDELQKLINALENKTAKKNLQQQLDKIKESVINIEEKLKILSEIETKAIRTHLEFIDNKLYDIYHEGYQDISALNNLCKEIEQKIKTNSYEETINKIYNLEEIIKTVNDWIDLNANEENKQTIDGSDYLKRKNQEFYRLLNDETVTAEKIKSTYNIIKDLLENPKEITYVKFKGDGWNWDTTIKNLYNCIEDAGFDMDRIENKDAWLKSCKNALHAMDVKNDTLQISQWFGTSCGTDDDDYTHKAMLKTLATFMYMHANGKNPEDIKDKVNDIRETKEKVKVDSDLQTFLKDS